MLVKIITGPWVKQNSLFLLYPSVVFRVPPFIQSVREEYQDVKRGRESWLWGRISSGEKKILRKKIKIKEMEVGRNIKL